MANVSQTIREIRQHAALACTPDLIMATAEEMVSLDDKLADLDRADLARGTAPDGESRYIEAFGAVMSAVLALAVFTTELGVNRQVAWCVEESSAPLGVSLN